MTIRYAILADAANISQDGKLNILGAFTHIIAPSFPAHHPSMTLAAPLQVDPEDIGKEFIAELTLIDPENKVHPFQAKFSISIPSLGTPVIQHNLVVNLVNVPFGMPGLHFLVLRVGDSRATQVPIEAVLKG